MLIPSQGARNQPVQRGNHFARVLVRVAWELGAGGSAFSHCVFEVLLQ